MELCGFVREAQSNRWHPFNPWSIIDFSYIKDAEHDFVMLRGSMGRSLAIPLGIVVARERVVHPIADVRWRAVDVMLDPPARADWRELRRGQGFEHYHAATLPLVLSATSLTDYRVNLANGEPCVYVVLQQRPGASPDTPLDVRAVSASPFDSELFSGASNAAVERVAMPKRLVAIVERFIAECSNCANVNVRAPRDESKDAATASSAGRFFGFGGRPVPSE